MMIPSDENMFVFYQLVMFCCYTARFVGAKVTHRFEASED
jgi:hypothetical protein